MLLKESIKYRKKIKISDYLYFCYKNQNNELIIIPEASIKELKEE